MIKWLAERLHQRCICCDTVNYWKWVCFKCHEETCVEAIDTLQLELDVVVLNVGNPGLIARLTVMDGDEVIGVVVPDSLGVIHDLGLIVPNYYKEKLRARDP